MFDIASAVGLQPPTQQADVTDLSQHVDGGTPATVRVNAAADRAVLYWAVGYIVGAVVILFALGALVFRSARL